MPTTSVSTPIPPSLSRETVIAALHNNDVMIKTLCPALISYEFVSGDPSTSAVYSVTDKKPLGQTTFKLTLTNTPVGVDTLVNAKPPVGTLTIAGTWRVEGDTLVEDVEIEANALMKKMAKGTVDKTHPVQHGFLLEQAQKA